MGEVKFPKTTKGQLGLRAIGGAVFEEFLARLRGTRGRAVYQEMYYNDPIVGGILNQFELKARQVKWTAKPKDNSNEARRAADIINKSLEVVSPSWTFVMSDLLTFLPFGWALFEPTYKTLGDMVVWNTLEFRAQDTLFKWETNDKNEPIAMVQFIPFTTGGKYFTIPLSKTIHVTTKYNKGNPEGVSVLRTAYRPWFFKKVIEEYEAIGIERDVSGIPVIQFTDPEFDMLDPANDGVVKWAENLVTTIHKDEQAGVVLPPGVSLVLLDSPRKSETGNVIDSVIRRYNQAIAIALSAQMMVIPFEERGNKSPVYNQLFLDSMDAWLAIVAEVINHTEKPRLLRWNGLEEYADKVTVWPARISLADKMEMAAFIARLVKMGVIIPDRRLEEELREDVSLPPPDDSTKRFIDGVFSAINGNTDGYVFLENGKAHDADYDILSNNSHVDGIDSSKEYVILSDDGTVLSRFTSRSIESAISKSVKLVNTNIRALYKSSYYTLAESEVNNIYRKIMSLY